MKNELDNLPPEVQAARAVLAGWLEKQRLRTARALRQWERAFRRVDSEQATLDRAAEEDPSATWDGSRILSRTRACAGKMNQHAETLLGAEEEETDILTDLLFQESNIMTAARPDLSHAEVLACAGALLDFRTSYLRGTSPPRVKRRFPSLASDLAAWLQELVCPDQGQEQKSRKRREKQSDLPGRLTDPRSLVRSLRALARHVQDDPEAYRQPDLSAAVLECARAANTAGGFLAEEGSL